MKRTIGKKLLTLLLAFVMAFTIMPGANAFAIDDDFKLRATSNEEKMPIGLSQGVYYRIRNAKTNQYLTSDKYGSLKLVDKKQAVKTDDSQFVILRYGNTKFRILSKNLYYLNLYKTTAGSLKKSTLGSLTTTAQNSTYFNITRGNVDSDASGLYYIGSSMSSYNLTSSSSYVVGKYIYNNDLSSAWAFEQVAECSKSKVLYSSQMNTSEAANAKIAHDSVIDWANSTSKKLSFSIATGNDRVFYNIRNFEHYLRQMESATNITSFAHAGQGGYYFTPNEQVNMHYPHEDNFMSQCKLAILAGCNTAYQVTNGNVCKDFYKNGVHTIIGFTVSIDLPTGAMYVKYFYDYAKLNDLATVSECHDYAIKKVKENSPVLSKLNPNGKIPSNSNTKIYGDKNALVNY